MIVPLLIAHQTSYNTQTHAPQPNWWLQKTFSNRIESTFTHSYAHCCCCGGCCWISLYRPDLEYRKINTNNISLFGLEWPPLFRATSTHLFLSFIDSRSPLCVWFCVSNESYVYVARLLGVHIRWFFLFSQPHNWMYNEICGKVYDVQCSINSSVFALLFPWAMHHFLFN